MGEDNCGAKTAPKNNPTWSKLVRRTVCEWPSLRVEALVKLEADMDMDRFVRAQNVQRYRNLLERADEQADREKLLSLLAEEEQKQKDAGDSLRPKVSPRL
jgi:hypothetical protein